MIFEEDEEFFGIFIGEQMEASIYRERFRSVDREDDERREFYETEKRNAAYRGEPEPPTPVPPDPDDRVARAFRFDCAGPNSLAKLVRYETIERSIDRNLRQLKAFQAARNAADAQPQPAETKPQPAPEPPTAPPLNADCEPNPKTERHMHNPAQPPMKNADQTQNSETKPQSPASDLATAKPSPALP